MLVQLLQSVGAILSACVLFLGSILSPVFDFSQFSSSGIPRGSSVTKYASKGSSTSVSYSSSGSTIRVYYPNQSVSDAFGGINITFSVPTDVDEFDIHIVSPSNSRSFNVRFCYNNSPSYTRFSETIHGSSDKVYHFSRSDYPDVDLIYISFRVDGGVTAYYNLSFSSPIYFSNPFLVFILLFSFIFLVVSLLYRLFKFRS